MKRTLTDGASAFLVFMSTSAIVSISDVTDFAAALLVAAGTPDAFARTVAEALVDADVEGLASHGTMLLPMYVDRIVAGSVVPGMEGRVVSDTGAQIVIDALIGQQIPHIEKIPRMLTVKGGDDLTGIEVGEADNLDFSEAKLLFDSG